MGYSAWVQIVQRDRGLEQGVWQEKCNSCLVLSVMILAGWRRQVGMRVFLTHVYIPRRPATLRIGTLKTRDRSFKTPPSKDLEPQMSAAVVRRHPL